MPFRRLTVVDVATLAAAPQIAAFFGDFGARVVKVEHPRGDSLRRLVDARGDALQWKIVNRNKQCVTLDLTRPAGRELLDRMLARADLLIAALDRDRLARWGLDERHLARSHPRLVVVNLTAYGSDGPWSERPGSGTLAEAMSGLAGLTGPAGGPPTLSPVGLGDYMGVLQGIIAALVGLYARDTGPAGACGEMLDVAMYEPLLGLLSQRIAAAVRDRVEPGRHGNRFPDRGAAQHLPHRRRRMGGPDGGNGRAGAPPVPSRRPARARRRRALPGQPGASGTRRRARSDHRGLDRRAPPRRGGRCVRRRRRLLAAVDGLLRVASNPHFRARGSLLEVDDPQAGPITLASPSPRRERDGPRVRHLGRERGADNRRGLRRLAGPRGRAAGGAGARRGDLIRPFFLFVPFVVASFFSLFRRGRP